jgi:hypothetical protein
MSFEVNKAFNERSFHSTTASRLLSLAFLNAKSAASAGTLAHTPMPVGGQVEDARAAAALSTGALAAGALAANAQAASA